VISLFTDPNREQRDAIAYIMTGQPLSSNSGKEQAKVAEAAAVIGSNVLTNQMGSKVGLDEARVEGGNSLEEASLVVGKYLNPRLFVSYGMGLFDRASSFKARYLVTTKWVLQTEAGTATGADVLFRTESGH
jgi:translocation and assembly module TamB